MNFLDKFDTSIGEECHILHGFLKSDVSLGDVKQENKRLKEKVTDFSERFYILCNQNARLQCENFLLNEENILMKRIIKKAEIQHPTIYTGGGMIDVN